MSVRALVALLATVAACSAPEFEPLPPGSTILAFGDSLTAGVGAGRDESFPTVLAELTGFEVVNAGVSGETTDGGRARLAQTLDTVDPAVMILLEGGNDILRNRNLAKTKADLAAMIELALERDVIVVLLGVPEKKVFSNSAPIYAELAEEYEVIFDGELLAGLLRSPGDKADTVHLNGRGYAKMAAGVNELLRDHGLIR